MLSPRISGFTLMELMVVLLIMGIAMGIAVPAYNEFAGNARLSTASSELLVDMALARGEAARRGQYVTLCRSANQTACATSGNDWSVGRIVFVDIDNDGVLDSGETVVRKTSAAKAGMTIQASVNNVFRVTYAPSGILSRGSASLYFSLCSSGRIERRVTVSTGGRAQTVKTSNVCS